MTFTALQSYRHGTPAKTAVLLVNLGTPDAPTPEALRRYLKQFLSDPRVVEIPRLVWWPILNGIILNTRPKKSAAKYASIWTTEGSPLRVHTERLAKLLRGHLGEAGHELHVAVAMRYGQPGIADVLRQLRAANCTRLLVVPLYPQYAGSTSATVMDEVYRELSQWRNQPELRMIRSFSTDSGYIESLANSIREHWQKNGALGPSDKLVLSFHGVPRRTLDLGDPYHCECHQTAHHLRQALGLAADQVQVCFQSRFGKAEWLQPYTAPTLIQLAQAGTRRVDVLCPGFVADCLETLEEIAIEAKADFLQAGGQQFHYLPCLNDRLDWAAALTALVGRHLAGWPTDRAGSAARTQACEAARLRALALGAKD